MSKPKTKKLPAPTRRLRHWKQRFNANAKFIWRRSVTWGGEKTVVGTEIPEALQLMPTKLRRFWESQTIELAEFEAPNVATGGKNKKPAKAKEPIDMIRKDVNMWVVEGHDKKVRTKKEALDIAERLIEDAKPKPEGLALIGDGNVIVINDETNSSKDILGFIMAKADMDTETWNAQSEDDRNATISQALQFMEDLGDDDEDFS